MDEHPIPAPDSAAQPIRITDINPLLSPPGTDNTLNAVAAVLATLSRLATPAGVELGYDFGVSLIHQWLEATLRFAVKHPDVKAVLPVARTPPSGGAS